ncbi:MAG: FHA domain-containing protein [Bacteroidales bacterium]|nr:FHA domain-containing protein [Lentimicrobiaceae bacterium]MBQ3593972.1 FHA domain-containing protein [Bacteroidales bacterium]
MGNSKTICPGMEGAYTSASNNFNQQDVNTPPQGTQFSTPFTTMHSPTMSYQKPIVGFLYSVSKTSAGEYWPLHVGSNSIGRSQDNDVCLSETTVSSQHAVLVVRQMKNPEKIIASICDSRSTCGTMINGESLGFDPRECFNGDVITIGEHYDLYFILIDAKQIGLNTCREFSPSDMNMGDAYSQSMSNDIPRTDYNDRMGSGTGTVGFDGQAPKASSFNTDRNTHTGTQFL